MEFYEVSSRPLHPFTDCSSPDDAPACRWHLSQDSPWQEGFSCIKVHSIPTRRAWAVPVLPIARAASGQDRLAWHREHSGDPLRLCDLID